MNLSVDEKLNDSRVKTVYHVLLHDYFHYSIVKAVQYILNLLIFHYIANYTRYDNIFYSIHEVPQEKKNTSVALL